MSRRRGTELIDAIHRATLQELVRVGFAALSFDRIAAAAGTGKAALYRRWTTTDQLVLDALTSSFAPPLTAPHTGSLRTDLIALLTRFVQVLDEPCGRALRPLLAHRDQHPELVDEVWRAIVRPAQEVLLEVGRAAVERGEADPARITGRTVSIGPRMLLVEAWHAGSVRPGEVAAIVDEVLLPVMRPDSR